MPYITNPKLSLAGSMLAACLLLLVSCTKTDKMELNKGDNPLSLTADKSTVVLEEKTAMPMLLHSTGQVAPIKEPIPLFPIRC